MISDRDLVAISRKDSAEQHPPLMRVEGEGWMRNTPSGRSGKWELRPVHTCRCCGAPAWPNLRCTKHQNRNPCAAEGCTRTNKATHSYREDVYLCGEHWRLFVPPGSPTRRAFNRLAKIARKAGFKRTDRWPAFLEDRWWRLWFGVIRRIRRWQGDGHIDPAEIERLFGFVNDQ